MTWRLRVFIILRMSLNWISFWSLENVFNALAENRTKKKSNKASHSIRSSEKVIKNQSKESTKVNRLNFFVFVSRIDVEASEWVWTKSCLRYYWNKSSQWHFVLFTIENLWWTIEIYEIIDRCWLQLNPMIRRCFQLELWTSFDWFGDEVKWKPQMKRFLSELKSNNRLGARFQSPELLFSL
jgi:hypothetical protein